MVAMTLLVMLDFIRPNLIAEVHALYFSTNTFVQVKVAFLTMGLLVISYVTYLTTPKSI